MNRRISLIALALTMIVSAGLSNAFAETFVLKGGDVLEGKVVYFAGSTLSIKLAGRGMRQLPFSAIDRVEVTLSSGDRIAGALIGWSKRGYEIESDGRRLAVRDGEVVQDVAMAEEPTKDGNIDQGIGGPRIEFAEVTEAPVREDDTATPAPPVTATTVLPSLTGSTTSVQEGDGDVVFRLALSEASSESVVVIYTAMNRAARSGADFQGSSGVAVIKPGETAVDVNVPLINDDIAEPDEEFVLFLSVDPNAAIIGDRHVVATISDDDT